LQQQWIRDVVGTVERNNFGREAQDGVNIAREILNITLDNPVGGFTLVGKELFQELPEAAVGGLAGLAGKVAGMTGVIVSQVLESAGGTYKESIQRIEDEIQKGFRAPMSRQDIESEAKANATKGGAITALLTALTPGGRTATGAIRNEMATEGLETYLTARASGVGHEDAIKESVVAGTIAGKVVGSTYAGDIAKQQVSNLTGQTGTPSASVTVTGRSGGRVAGLDDSGELAFVVTDAGNTLVIPSVNVTNNVPVVAGEFVSLSANNQIVASSPTKEGLSIVLPGTSGAGGQGNVNAPATTSPTIISSGPSALDMQNIMASSQYGQGAVNRPTTGAAQVTVGGTPAGVQPTTPAVSTMPIPGGGTQPVTSGSQADGARAAAEQARQAEIAARNFADLQSRTYKGQVYVTAEEAANARLADTAPKTPAATPAYSANVPATPEVVAELLALKGLPSSPGAIRILLAGNPTVAQVGQEIEVLSEMVRQRGVTQQPSTQPAGTPTVSTGQQGGPTVITQGGTETKPATQPTTTPATRPTTTPAVTPTTQPSVTETIDLTGTTGRVNIDTVSPVDTTGQDTTFLDTTPTGTRPVNTGPALDTGPAEETTPTYGEDDDIIRFLGLDRIAEQPVERAEPVAEPEDTTPGAVAGPADVATEEQLAIAPRPVYTPKPGTRVVDTGSSILPTRVQLSEGMGDDVEGTGEEEQQPVWNVRSLKLRRALGI
jgi:hypothetical protein